MTWHLLAAGLAMASSAVVAVATDPAESGVEIVDVASEPFRRMTVPVTIQGTGPYRFLIDTGAQATVLSLALADKLALSDRRTATLVGIASRRQVETTAVSGIALGSRTFDVRNAPLVDGVNIGGADGVLGLDSLQNQRVLIDFRDKAIHVADAQQLGGNRGYEIVVRAKRKLGQLIITQAELDGVRVAVIVDTGAQGSTGNMALLARLRRAHPLGDGTMTDINGVSLTGDMRMGRMLSFDRAQIQNLAILFAPSPTFDALGLTKEPALVLGMEQLRLFDRVAIDFQSQRVLFDVPSATAFVTGSRIRR